MRTKITPSHVHEPTYKRTHRKSPIIHCRLHHHPTWEACFLSSNTSISPGRVPGDRSRFFPRSRAYPGHSKYIAEDKILESAGTGGTARHNNEMSTRWATGDCKPRWRNDSVETQNHPKIQTRTCSPDVSQDPFPPSLPTTSVDSISTLHGRRIF